MATTNNENTDQADARPDGQDTGADVDVAAALASADAVLSDVLGDSAPAPRKRARRATKSASAPASSEGADTTSAQAAAPASADEPAAAQPEAKPARKRATRKSSAKSAAPAVAPAAAAEGGDGSDDAQAPDAAEPAPARKRATRKRATKKAAAPETLPVDVQVADADADGEAQTPAQGEVPAAPAAELLDDTASVTPGPEATADALDADVLGTVASGTEPLAGATADALADVAVDDDDETPEDDENPEDGASGESRDGDLGDGDLGDGDQGEDEGAGSPFSVLFQPATPTSGTRRRASRGVTTVPEVSLAPSRDDADGSSGDSDDSDDRADRREGAERARDDEPAQASSGSEGDGGEPEEDGRREPRGRRTSRNRRRAAAADTAEDGERSEPEDASESETDTDDESGQANRRRRRRGGKGRGRRDDEGSDAAEQSGDDDEAGEDSGDRDGRDDSADDDQGGSSRRRRRRRRAGNGNGDGDDEPGVSTRVRTPRAGSDEPTALRGSTRLEAKKQRRREGREAGRRRTVITEAEFLARRESVDRVMVVRNSGDRTQMGVLEDGVLVEHYIDTAEATSMVGNIYLGRVQNVLPSMEAAFVDVGKGRNAVLYAGEVNWDAAGLEGNQARRIENALEPGQPVLVQVTKDPIGHKGARLTSQISLPGRFLVYVPNSSMTGISRKLPDTERARLKRILRDVLPEDAGVIVRTAAEGASEQELRADVERLTQTWEQIQETAQAAGTPSPGKSKGRKKNGKSSGSASAKNAPLLLHGEPDMTVRVIRDVFNEDFKQLIVDGQKAWDEIHPYITSVAPDLADRVTRWSGEKDLFTAHRVDEQIAKAMDRKVWLPSGGSLIIDRTEAMTVVDVNTGKFIGSGGNLEETVTRNNLEAAEEVVRQLRLRDIGGIIVVDFIDMVLESNRDLVVRRLLECLGRDRTKHQVAEVTSLGLVQMTRKRVGSGLIEVFSESCEHCNGRGYVIHSTPVTKGSGADTGSDGSSSGSGSRSRRGRDRSTGNGNGNNGANSNGNNSNGNNSNGGSNTGNTGNGSSEPARTGNGPSAAQIAAAAHAAALRKVAPVDAAEPVPQQQPGSAVTSFPEDDGPWGGVDAPVVEETPTAAEVDIDSPVEAPVEPSSEEPSPVQGAEPDPQEGTQPGHAGEGTGEREQVGGIEPDAQTQPRRGGRRRRGRVSAPAGPPKGATD